MKIIGKGNKEIFTLDDYKKYSPPKKEYQWADEHSAKEFARKVVSGILDNELKVLFPGIDVVLAYPEKETYFDQFSGPRNHDLACIAEFNNEKISLCFEAKATEDFGSATVKQELDKANNKIKNGENSNIPQRINCLVDKLWNKPIDKSIENLRYQLLHATAGTISFAKENNINKAIFVVYQLETAKTSSEICDDHFEALKDFVNQFGKTIEKNVPCYIKQIDNVDLSILFLQRKKDIDLEDLQETWSIIEKNKYMETDGQIINFYRAVRHGKAIVIDATPEMLAALTEDDADIVKRINLLFDMMAEAQEKALKKD